MPDGVLSSLVVAFFEVSMGTATVPSPHASLRACGVADGHSVSCSEQATDCSTTDLAFRWPHVPSVVDPPHVRQQIQRTGRRWGALDRWQRVWSDRLARA